MFFAATKGGVWEWASGRSAGEGLGAGQGQGGLERSGLNRSAGEGWGSDSGVCALGRGAGYPTNGVVHYFRRPGPLRTQIQL